MDLDHFKDINDNHGHHVGDRALREVAGVLRAAIRPYDICVRYAGDEFIVVLSGCGAEEAERKRVELQTAIDELVFEARPGKRLQLGISIGAAIFPHDGNTYETLLATADSRMYRDKAKRKSVAEKTDADGGSSSPRETTAAISDADLSERLCRTLVVSPLSSVAPSSSSFFLHHSSQSGRSAHSRKEQRSTSRADDQSQVRRSLNFPREGPEASSTRTGSAERGLA